jgi:hypothetical protein
MKQNTQETVDSRLEKRSRALFQHGVDGIDFATRSRLTQARHAALAAAGGTRLRSLRTSLWKPAAGVAAAAALGIALWHGPLSGTLSGKPGLASDSQGQTNLEDLDIVASTDQGAGDAIEMLQDDLDFYDFADKAANAGPAA